MMAPSRSSSRYTQLDGAVTVLQVQGPRMAVSFKVMSNVQKRLVGLDLPSYVRCLCCLYDSSVFESIAPPFIASYQFINSYHVMWWHTVLYHIISQQSGHSILYMYYIYIYHWFLYFIDILLNFWTVCVPVCLYLFCPWLLFHIRKLIQDVSISIPFTHGGARFTNVTLTHIRSRRRKCWRTLLQILAMLEAKWKADWRTGHRHIDLVVCWWKKSHVALVAAGLLL